MQISKADAVAIFEDLGVPTAAKWSAKRLRNKLQKIESLVQGDREYETRTMIDEVLSAVEDGDPIEVITEDAGAAEVPNEEPKKKKGKKKKDKKDKKKKKRDQKLTVEEPTEENADPPEEPTADATTVTSSEADDKPEADDKGRKKRAIPGVNPSTKNRNYIAGLVIKKYGLKNGLTDAMVGEVNDKYEKAENDTAALAALRAAWHTINGYSAE